MTARVLITGISGFTGSRIARALEESSDIEFICGVGLSESPIPLARTEFIKADLRSPLIAKVLTSTRADTVIHADLLSTPAVAGGRSVQKERNVIGTMQLLAACQRSEWLKKVVVRSSTAVYGSDPGDPSILSEERSEHSYLNTGYARDIAEAESYARDFGRRRQDVTLTILRMANVVGPSVDSNFTQLFSLPLVPTGLGFDPRLQMLHEDDAVEVLRLAALEKHPGVFNVAGEGVIYLSQAIRMARRLPMPVVLPLASFAGSALRKLGAIDFSLDQISLLVHGRVADTTRLRTVFGFDAKYSTFEAFKDFIRFQESSPKTGRLVEMEGDLYQSFLDMSSRWTGPPKPYLVHDATSPRRSARSNP